jgi:hypothetical protein
VSLFLEAKPTMVESLKRFWNERPLFAIMLIALAARLVAAVFSKGYGMHDDHFGPIEQPFIIMQYFTYWSGRVFPHGHSVVYPSVQYGLMASLQSVGMTDPQAQMYVIRLVHAVYSLLVVFFGYKIAETLSNREVAKKAGLILALFWVIPFLSVRTLVEAICIPPLMGGLFYSLKSRESLRNAFIAGLWFALAFTFRYQTLLISGTVGGLFLLSREFRQLFWLIAGFVLLALLVQGTADTLAWGYPFASFMEYVRYNMAHGEEYTTGPWYNYILLVSGALIPPMSFLLLYGFFRNWRKTLLIFLPVLVFFVLHSYFPNKQERFILPVLPAILVLGVVGWEEVVAKSAYWAKHPKTLRRLWIAFWALNIILLLPFSTYYGKQSRIEAMYALHGKPVTGLILAGGKVGTSQPPFFYAGTYPVPYFEVNSREDLQEMKAELQTFPVRFSHVIFFGQEDLEQRVRNLESEVGLTLKLEKALEPSFLDIVFYRLNPRHNKNELTFVYAVTTAPK